MTRYTLQSSAHRKDFPSAVSQGQPRVKLQCSQSIFGLLTCTELTCLRTKLASFLLQLDIRSSSGSQRGTEGEALVGAKVVGDRAVWAAGCARCQLYHVHLIMNCCWAF